MDLQIYKINGIENSRDVLPTMKYFIKVISKMDKNTYYISNNKKREIFLDGINPEDIILLEIPPIPERNSQSGMKSVRTKITNLRSNKSIIVPGSAINEFWDAMKEIQVIDHGNI